MGVGDSYLDQVMCMQGHRPHSLNAGADWLNMLKMLD
jgi:hypothetical protein